MSKTQRRIGVLTAGGDAPGLNAVIRAVVKGATRRSWTVVGIQDGFEGLLGQDRNLLLSIEDVRGLLPRGGSILGCTNKGHFGLRLGEHGWIKDEKAYNEALVTFKGLGLDALVVIGGDGSHRIAYQLLLMGIPLVGVPKTIDNDLAETELTFGFDTALEVATDAIDRLHTTAESHDRVMLVEVMGRHAGWIALLSGIAGGADVILIPEIPFFVQKVVAKISERDALGRKFSIIVVAEGSHASGQDLIYREDPAGVGEGRLGGIAERLGREIGRITGKETRAVVLGHLQRGGSPTAIDRVMASACGAAAIHAIEAGKFGQVMVWKGNEVVPIPLELAIREVKKVPPSHQLVSVARDLGISFAGSED